MNLIESSNIDTNFTEQYENSLLFTLYAGNPFLRISASSRSHKLFEASRNLLFLASGTYTALTCAKAQSRTSTRGNMNLAVPGTLPLISFYIDSPEVNSLPVKVGPRITPGFKTTRSNCSLSGREARKSQAAFSASSLLFT